jgi:enoyl-CoA hydratase
MSYVTVEKMGRAGVIGLDRPNALNALNLEMIEAIASALDAFEADPVVELIILRSNGEKAFCAGGDMHRIRALSLTGHYDEAEHFFHTEYDLNLRIASFPKPYISLIDGICMGGGLGLSIHGNYRIASERAVFAMPETAIGFLPDVGGSYFLSRMPYYSGYWMGLTGARVNGLDTTPLGLATHFADSQSIQALFEDLCDQQGSIETLLRVHCSTVHYQSSILYLEMMTQAFSHATLYSIDQGLSKMRQAVARTAQESMRSASPRSLQETISLLQYGRSSSLKTCLEREFEAAQRAIRHPDFAEGVRAVLVDKDHSPNWQSAHGFDPLASPNFITETYHTSTIS